MSHKQIDKLVIKDIKFLNEYKKLCIKHMKYIMSHEGVFILDSKSKNEINNHIQCIIDDYD